MLYIYTYWHDVYIYIYMFYLCMSKPIFEKKTTHHGPPCLPSNWNRGKKAWITIYIYIHIFCIYLYYSVFIILYYSLLMYHWLLFLIIYFKYWCLNHHGSLAPLEPQDDWWKICGREMPLLSRFLDRVQKMLGEKYLHFLFGQARCPILRIRNNILHWSTTLLHIHRGVGDSWENHGIRSESMWCSLGSMDVWISYLNGFTDSDSVDPIWHQLHGGSSMPSPDSTKQIVLDSMRLSPTFSCDRSLLTFYFTLEEWFEIFYV